MMQNIELFDEFVALALAQLYSAFPAKIFLDVRELSGHFDEDDFGGIVDETGLTSRRADIAFATIDWLADTGYIRTGEKHPFGFRDAILTAAGLEVLKASPKSLKVKDTIGERLVRFTKEGSSMMAKEVAKAAISAGISMIPRN